MELSESKYIESKMVIKVILFLLLVTLVYISCHNPFAPKEEADMAGSSCIDFKEVDNLFCAFCNSYAFKDTTLYGSLFAPNFIFSYVDYDRGVDVSWGRDDEMRSAYGLFQSVQSLALIWNNVIFSSGDDTSHSIIRGFSLTVTFNPADIISVDGYANLTFNRANKEDNWHILRWRDESNF
jgi:hypothetical protein